MLVRYLLKVLGTATWIYLERLFLSQIWWLIPDMWRNFVSLLHFFLKGCKNVCLILIYPESVLLIKLMDITSVLLSLFIIHVLWTSFQYKPSTPTLGHAFWGGEIMRTCMAYFDQIYAEKCHQRTGWCSLSALVFKGHSTITVQFGWPGSSNQDSTLNQNWFTEYYV